jgi:hypothetical protein
MWGISGLRKAADAPIAAILKIGIVGNEVFASYIYYFTSAQLTIISPKDRLRLRQQAIPVGDDAKV